MEQKAAFDVSASGTQTTPSSKIACSLHSDVGTPDCVSDRAGLPVQQKAVTACSKMKISSLLDYTPTKAPIPRMPVHPIQVDALRYPPRCSLPALPRAVAPFQFGDPWNCFPQPIAPPLPLVPRFQPLMPPANANVKQTTEHAATAPCAVPHVVVAARRARVLPGAGRAHSPPSLFGFALQVQLSAPPARRNPVISAPLAPESLLAPTAPRRCYYEARRHRDGGPVCRKCGKVFKSKQGVNRHNHTVHLKLRPYKCADCAASFGQKCSLQRHQRKVHNRKHIPFECEHARCVRQFADYRLLQAHIKEAHNGEPPFRCAVQACSAEFMWRSSHASHMKVSHGLRGLETVDE